MEVVEQHTRLKILGKGLVAITLRREGIVNLSEGR
jgi:hypothetical protein